MTTNENINMTKYRHFFDSYNRFDNPFDLGNAKENLLDGLFPNNKQVYTREEAEEEREKKININSGAVVGTDREGLLRESRKV